MPRATSGFSQHLQAIDGLRGMAILLVVLPHVQLTDTLPGPEIVQKTVFSLGHGVELFFVLSGFGLALPLLRSINETSSGQIDLATYAFNRVFRIVPLYYVALVLVLAFNVLYRVSWHTLPPTLSLPHSPWQLFGQIFFFDRNIDMINSSFWSIPIQLRWYVMFPFLLMLFVRSRRAFFALLLALVVAYNATRFHQIDVGTLPLFMLGIVAADIFVRQHPVQRWGIGIMVLGIVLGHIGDRWASAPDQYGVEVAWTMQPTTLGWQIAAFGLVLAATANEAFRTFFASRPMVYLGLTSFSIYLIHEPVVEIGSRIFRPHGGLIVAGLAIGAGGILWALVERRISSRALRQRLRVRALPYVRSALAFCGAPASIALSVQTEPKYIEAEVVPQVQAAS